MKIPKIISRTLHPIRKEQKKPNNSQVNTATASQDAEQNAATPRGDSLYSNPSSEGTQQETRGVRAAIGHLVPPPGPATKFTGAMDTLRNLGRTRRPPLVVISPEEDRREILQVYEDTKSKGHALSRGIVAVSVDGNLRIDDALSSFAGKMIDSYKSERGASIKKTHRSGMVTVSISDLNADLLSEIVSDKKFKEMVLGLCMPGKIRVSVMNSEGSEIDWPDRSTSRKKVYLKGMDGHEQKVSEKHTALVSTATALTLRCLAENNYQVAAKIAGRVPEVVLKEIFQLPVQGNLMTRPALVEMIRSCSVVSVKRELTPHAVAASKEAISRSLTHYFQYAPVLGLSASVNTKLSILAGRDKKADLLVQNQPMFLQEMRHLVADLMVIPSNRKDSNDAVRASAFHVADLIGHAFVYLIDFSEKLAGDQADLRRREQEIASVINAIVSTGLQNTPSPAGVDGAFELSAATFFDRVSKWLSQSESELELGPLAKNLGKMSEAVSTNSSLGLLVPGEDYLSVARFEELPEVDKERRVHAGVLFADAYVLRLREFSRGDLEKSADSSAKQVD